MFEPGQKLRHKRSGKIVNFRYVFSKGRLGTKILTTDPDLGPILSDQFEIVEDEAPVQKPDWPLKMSPQNYLDRFGDSAKNSALAKEVLSV